MTAERKPVHRRGSKSKIRNLRFLVLLMALWEQLIQIVIMMERKSFETVFWFGRSPVRLPVRNHREVKVS